MKLLVMDMPEEPAQLAGWLEEQLLGPRLAVLVAELTAVHGPPPAAVPALPDWLGSRLPDVLAHGLTSLPQPQQRELLLVPQLLLDLQELILVRGGAYWERKLPAAIKAGDAIQRGRRQLEAYVAVQQPAAPAPQVLSMSGRIRPRAWRPWVAAAAVAAAVLLAVDVYLRVQPAGSPQVAVLESPQWGWGKQGALPADVPRAVYLNRLAEEAEEWFAERPVAADPLAKRLSDLRRGCSVLIFASHQPLSSADRLWLPDRCRSWGKKLDRHLEALEAGQDPLLVRTQADDTVRNLIDALRERASQT